MSIFFIACVFLNKVLKVFKVGISRPSLQVYRKYPPNDDERCLFTFTKFG